MSTLSIMCLGTSHSRDEPWSLMTALFDLVAATEITEDQLRDPNHSLGPGDHKIIFDGPAVFGTSNATLHENSELACQLIHASQPDTVCLLGHSRGAVLCAMIAAKCYHPPYNMTAKRFQLFLVDIVAHTHALGGLPTVGRDLGLTVYRNTRSLVRVVMEDEYEWDEVFPLEDVRVSERMGGGTGPSRFDHDREQTITEDAEFIRLPGGHGSATQVNPIKRVDELLPPGSILTERPGSIWPIGEVCLTTALLRLKQWGVGLIDESFATEAGLFNAYANVLRRHPRRPDGQVLLNDVNVSKPGEKQKISYVEGQRSGLKLADFGSEFRQPGQLVVNDQHLALYRQHGQALERAIMTGTGSRDRVLMHPDDVALATQLDELHRTQPAAYGLLVHGGYSFGGAKLFDRILVP